jgi:hypothetical protein
MTMSIKMPAQMSAAVVTLPVAASCYPSARLSAILDEVAPGWREEA